MEEFDLEFNKLNLKPEDILIIKVDTSGLSEEESLSRLSTIRNDSFVEYIKSKGNPVLISYSGLSFEILRTEKKDKVLVYVDITGTEESEAEKYQEYIKHKLKEDLGEKVVIIPTKKEFPIAVKVSEE